MLVIVVANLVYNVKNTIKDQKLKKFLLFQDEEAH